MQSTNRATLCTALLIAVASAVALIGTTSRIRSGEPSADGAKPAAPAHAAMVAVPTGETVNGVPVYRLPAIAVTANRKFELAMIAGEEAIARAKRDHASVAATAPALPATPVNLASRSALK
jgi:hypothetical protein